MLARLYYTLRPLKPRQWLYRIVQPITKRLAGRRFPKDEALTEIKAINSLNLLQIPVSKSFQPSENSFSALNITQIFRDGIDWNFGGHGLLWTFNLHYFEWLYDEGLTVDKRLETMRSFAAQPKQYSIYRQAYPASLRIVAWTRFLLRNGIKEGSLLRSLYADADWVFRFPEYALDGNHLWENACAMLQAGAAFSQQQWLQKGGFLLRQCLHKQLFEDGGHKEGSPAYHSLLLLRTLETVELLRALQKDAGGILKEAALAAQRMLGWLQNHTFSDGTTPAFNDAPFGVAPSTEVLTNYATALSISPVLSPSCDSGYYVIRTLQWEMMIDAANIEPPFQPGHTHADTGTFCLHLHAQPFIVDTGVSTYNPSPRRKWERGSSAHNVLTVEEENSSDIWKSFRVGRRARIKEISVLQNSATCSHDGYKRQGIIIERRIEWATNEIRITDRASNAGMTQLYLRLHFHPEITLASISDTKFIAGSADISVEGASKTWCDVYEWCGGFNIVRPASRLNIRLSGVQCSVTISIQQ